MSNQSEQITAIIDRGISGILDLADAAYGSHSHWKCFRRILLKKLNQIKNEIGRKLEEGHGLGNERDYRNM